MKRMLVEDGFKVAVLGDDARALAMILALRGEGVELMAIGDKINPQIARLAQCKVAKDPLQIVQLITDWSAELVLVGAEKYFLPINTNEQISIVDKLESEGIPVAAPGYLASQVELDKAWLVELLASNGLGEILPESVICCGARDVNLVLKTIDDFGDVAIKPADLTGGKGVKVSGVQLKDAEEAKLYAEELLRTGRKIVIQRKMVGDEFSLQGFVYETGPIEFAPLVMDFKQLIDGKVIPNPFTGGMGSISYADGLLPFVDKKTLKETKLAMERIVILVEEKTGHCFRGPIYGQFMRLKDGRWVLIEINARLGNSEAMNILPLLAKGAFLKICRDMVSDDPVCEKINFRKRATVVKYVVPKGYPGESSPVEINLAKTDKPVELFFGGIAEDDEGKLVTDGSRAIAVRAEADDVPTAAAKIVNEAILEIFAGCLKDLHYREKIGLEE